jgi:hypothetical protein
MLKMSSKPYQLTFRDYEETLRSHAKAITYYYRENMRLQEIIKRAQALIRARGTNTEFNQDLLKILGEINKNVNQETET